jgi:hypothetical protein
MNALRLFAVKRLDQIKTFTIPSFYSLAKKVALHVTDNIRLSETPPTPSLRIFDVH